MTAFLLFIIFCVLPAALLAYTIFLFRENSDVKSPEIRKRALISGAIGIVLIFLLIVMF